MPLVALAVMLLGQFNKRGQAVRIVVGVGVAAGIQGTAIGLFSASQKFLELIPLVYLNALLPLLVALYLLARGARLPFGLRTPVRSPFRSRTA